MICRAGADDHISEAIPGTHDAPAMLYSKKPPEASLGIAGKAGDWKTACENVKTVPAEDEAARTYFETNFQPYAVSGPDGDEGLFTGYYEAQLRGSLKRGGKYRTPLYARPDDLITADLGDFKPELKGQHITGKVVKGTLKPYDDRAAIEKHP